MVDFALCKKLVIRPDSAVLILGCPDNLNAQFPASDGSSHPDVILAFARNQATLAECVPTVLAAYRRGGALWVAYPKTSGTIASDITRDKGWDRMAKQDLLPVSQVSIDIDWSALRFRFRDEIGKLTRAADYPGQANNPK